MPTKLTTRAFIEKARLVHGEKYDYTRVEFTHQDHKITILCPEHDSFEQALRSHLRGSGCPKCYAKRTTERRQSTTSFIEKARSVHGLKYDYTKVDYLGPYKKILIICPEHGEFEQSPSGHLNTGGCRKCGIARMATIAAGTSYNKSAWIGTQRGRKATLYIIYIEESEESFYKIGITYRNIFGRFQSRMPYNFKTVALYKSDDAAEIYDLEHSVHQRLKRLKYKPLIKFEGCTECFSSISPIIDCLPSSTLIVNNAFT